MSPVEIMAAGTPLPEARAAVLMFHGRGATALEILSLAGPLEADGVAFVAPQAPGRCGVSTRNAESS